jgi:hypothetical protein
MIRSAQRLHVSVAALLAASIARAQNAQFAPRVDFDLAQPHPMQSATADLDLDANLDIVVTCEGQNSGKVSVLFGDGASDFGTSTDFVSYLAWGLCVDDFNGDGWPDVAVTSYGWAQHGINIYLNNHQRGFTWAGQASSLGTPPVALASGDFDLDGIVDLAVANESGGYAVDWFHGNGDGTFSSFHVVPYTLGLTGRRLVAGDFDNDSRTDLALAHASGVMILMNVAQTYEQFHVSSQPMPTGSINALATADVDFDGDLDLVTGGTTVDVWRNFGNGGFGLNASYAVNGGVGDLRVADIDGNGEFDVMVTNLGGIELLFGQGGGVLGANQHVASGAQPLTGVLGDWNNDGRADLAVACNNYAADAYLSVHTQIASPAPAAYCSAKTSSLGCIPSIGFHGGPHLTGSLPFEITASAILNQKAGILIYGFQRGAGNFQGGTLCISGGVKRTPMQTSGGSASGNDCSGSFAFDMQGRRRAGSTRCSRSVSSWTLSTGTATRPILGPRA